MATRKAKAAHVPPPYEVIVDNLGNNPDIHIHAKGYGFVAGIGGGKLSTRKASAKFIVRACNSHGPLRDAVVLLQRQLSTIRFSEWPKGTGEALGISPEEMDELLMLSERALGKAGPRTITDEPDLVSVLKMIVKAWESIPQSQQVPEEINVDGMWDAARAAIAKAEGKPS